MAKVVTLKDIYDQQQRIIELITNPLAGRYMTRADIYKYSAFLRSKEDFQRAEKDGALTPITERPKMYLADEIILFHEKKERELNGTYQVNQRGRTEGVASRKQSLLSTLKS